MQHVEENGGRTVGILNYILRGKSDDPDDPNVKRAVDIASATLPLLGKQVGDSSGRWKNPFAPDRTETSVDLDLYGLEEFLKEQDPKLLWRCLPERFPAALRHTVGPIANHSLYDLLFLSLAIYGILKEGDVPSFLLFTFGPVQSFISRARKTSDLWAGSYLLSYLTFRSMLPILEELGPYHIIFPHLLRQPLIDVWMKEKFKNWPEGCGDRLRTGADDLSVANMPNRFLAIVPYREAECLADSVKLAFYDTLNALAERVEEFVGGGDGVVCRIEEQLGAYFQRYWVVLPWTTEGKDPAKSSSLDPVLEDYRKLLNLNGGGPPAYEVVSTLKGRDGANVGLAYPLLYDIAERFLGARKSVRDFEGITQSGEKKCSLCGQYDPLSIHWEDLRERYPGIVKEKERLCGVCATKRVLPRIVGSLEYLTALGRLQGYPSTSEMATVYYKRKIPGQVAGGIKKTLKGSVLRDCIGMSESVPCLKDRPLYNIDGQWLFRESYRKDYIASECGIDVSEDDLREVWKSVEGLLNNCSPETAKPNTYYAILMMDGDLMGKWLSGNHEGIPEFVYLLSREYSDRLPRELKCLKHPISPVLHGLFSRLLSGFALEEVRRWVEGCACGKLVYAGGDDVLALLPLEDALKVAINLRNAFRSRVSCKADMSGGVVFVHHKYPLSLALEEARDAEKRAKRDYGRAALYVKFIKRGGETREFGLKWERTFYTFQQLVEYYRKGFLPSGFGYDLMRVMGELRVEAEDKEIPIPQELMEVLENELVRILKRKGIASDEVVSDLKHLFKNMENKRHFADALVVANFLAKGGRDA